MSLEALYRGVVIGNWLVFGGVAIEETPALLTFTTFIKEKFVERRSRTGVVVWLKKREKVFESIGLVVLLSGLLVESQYEGAARSSEANARIASERIIVDLELRASDAEGRIADAKRSAASANRDAARLGVTLKSLQSVVDAARIKADQSTSALRSAQDAFEANLKAANDRNAEIEKRLAPRWLDDSQVESLTDLVTPYSGQKFSGLVLPAAADAERLWDRIALALINAGWVNVGPSSDTGNTGDPPARVALTADLDVSIIMPDDPEPVATAPGPGPRAASGFANGFAATALADNLEGFGIHAKTLVSNKRFPAAFGIIVEVGLKSQ